MQGIYSIVIVSVTLYIVYLLRNKAKADAVISELVVQPKAEEIKDAVDIAKLTQEIEDAKIGYATDRDRARTEYFKSRR